MSLIYIIKHICMHKQKNVNVELSSLRKFYLADNDKRYIQKPSA